MMDFGFVPPIQPTGDSFREKPRLFSPEKNRKTDSKVKGLVLEKIGDAAEQEGKTGLLLSATAPRIKVDHLASLAVPALLAEKEEERIELIPSNRQSKPAILKREFGKKIPIGLIRCEPHGWINAWMQFLLFIPGIPDLFCFAPRSFDAFREFVDQYLVDQCRNRPISSANGASVVKCLLKTMPPQLFHDQNNIDLYELLKAFFNSIFPSAVLHPDRHLVWDMNGKSFEEEIQKKIQLNPPEIFIATQGVQPHGYRSIQRQFFTPSRAHYYDLDAFIERRLDGRNGAMHVAYVKVDGSWYQCDDERITALRSTALSEALYRTVLFHYRKIGGR